jgi:hypothetical protein
MFPIKELIGYYIYTLKYLLPSLIGRAYYIMFVVNYYYYYELPRKIRASAPCSSAPAVR